MLKLGLWSDFVFPDWKYYSAAGKGHKSKSPISRSLADGIDDRGVKMPIPNFDVATAFVTYEESQIKVLFIPKAALADMTSIGREIIDGLKRAVEFVRNDKEHIGYQLYIVDSDDEIAVTGDQLSALLARV
ncbi:hypothetical protein N8E89_23580 (plasmid) [Phyllobacterium sp. A18/5-2]|uniref:hypothetical protein n=1 Tax=Phyllobacterium sp. A18/5-2 TaxID=2978392 RepID=UPI0021C659CF|nr:hypothetical protein [Phyllobacterium sp. A18/5-2]UXN66177.1 hypothetical protein N8E89_23580 [Phyllobacterium sp. A18/5-2]